MITKTKQRALSYNIRLQKSNRWLDCTFLII